MHIVFKSLVPIGLISSRLVSPVWNQAWFGIKRLVIEPMYTKTVIDNAASKIDLKHVLLPQTKALQFARCRCGALVNCLVRWTFVL